MKIRSIDVAFLFAVIMMACYCYMLYNIIINKGVLK